MIDTHALTELLKDLVKIDSVNFDGTNVVWFDLLGAPHSGAIGASPTPLTVGSVVITAGDRNITINVEPVTGRIQIPN